MKIGSAERIIGVGRRLMALFGWRRRILDAFLDLNRPEEQWEFWHRRLDTTGFRVSTDALFSRTGLRLAYAGPLVDSVPRGFGRVIRSRLERCWKTHSNRHNPYARDLLLGDLPATPTRASGPIRFQCADAASFLESCAPGSFDGFTLSNIVDGASETYCRRLFAAVRRAATPDAVVVSRSIGEPRQETATNLAAQDRSVLWGIVEVRSAAGL